MLELYLALRLDLPRLYWAVGTVYITSQVLAGDTRSKALNRVLGTLLGAAVSVALVPNLVNAPVFLSLAIATWVSFCLYFSLLDRTPRSYVVMLAGYTAGITARVVRRVDCDACTRYLEARVRLRCVDDVD